MKRRWDSLGEEAWERRYCAKMQGGAPKLSKSACTLFDSRPARNLKPCQSVAPSELNRREDGTIYFSNHPEVRRGGKLFASNAWTSIIAFCIDLVVLWVLVHFAGFPRVVAASIGFLIGISSHYLLSRKFVFPDSDRGMGRGYFYFMLNGGVGLVVTIGLFWGLMQAFPQIHYLILRSISSLAAGILVFFLNAIFNFQELGNGK